MMAQWVIAKSGGCVSSRLLPRTSIGDGGSFCNPVKASAFTRLRILSEIVKFNSPETFRSCVTLPSVRSHNYSSITLSTTLPEHRFFHKRVFELLPSIWIVYAFLLQQLSTRVG